MVGLLCTIGQRKKIVFPRRIRGRRGGSRSTICVKRREEEILVDENPTVPLLPIVWSLVRFPSLNKYDMID